MKAIRKRDTNDVRWETHAHTCEVSPCASISATELVDKYIQAGYAGLMVSDHYCDFSLLEVQRKPWQTQADHLLSGYRKAAEYGARRGLRVALGCELTFNGEPNDYLIMGMDEEDFARYPRLHTMGRRLFRELANERGWLIYQAHPYRYGMTPVEASWLDGMEVCNTHPTHQSHNAKALAFAARHGLWMSCGSDTHHANQTPRGGWLLDSSVNDARGMVASIRARGGRISMLGDHSDDDYMIGG